MVTMAYADKEVTVGGLSLHYQEWGAPEAPPILMLHGFGVSGHMFDEFAERMQDRYRLIALDQRGHGDSGWAPDGDYTRQTFVEDVELFRKALGLERFVLLGHSMGGLNAVSYAVEHPQCVESLVLVDVGPEAAKEGVDNIVRFTRGPDELDFDEFVEMAHRFNQRRTLENIRERMRHRLKPLQSGKWTWKFDKRFRAPDSGLRVGSELTNDQTWALYRAIGAPTLLIRGGESDVLTPEVADRCVREMQRARLAVVPGAGHSVPGDSPDAFTEVVRAFLDDVGRGKFEPVVVADLPPLAELVTAESRRAAQRGPSVTTMVLIGAGAAVALGGILLVSRRPAQPKAAAKARTSDSPGPLAGSFDAASAGALIESLSAAAERNTARARTLVEQSAVAPRAATPRPAQAPAPRRRRPVRTATRFAFKAMFLLPRLALARRQPKPPKSRMQRLLGRG
ncbi:MAG: alpha/beta fold hydrolase [Dehalococcoidia bacterium]